MKYILLLVLFIASVNLNAQSPEYVNKMVEFFKVSGSYNDIESSVDYIITEYKGIYFNVPEEFWIKHLEQYKSEYLNDFANKLAPIYNKYLTLEDIDFVIKFYQSETGKKFSKLTAKLVDESSVAGEKWGEYISEVIVSELQKAGYSE